MLSKVFASVVIVITFASCGLFRKSTKQVEKSSLEVVNKRDSTLSEKTQKDSLQHTIKTDRGVIVTETETITVTEKKGGKVSGSVGLDKLKSGVAILLKDSAGFKISALLDTLNNKLSINSESPSEKETKHTKQTITEHKDVKEESEKKGAEQVQKQVAVNHEQRQKESTKIENIQKEPKGTSFIWFWLGIGLAVCLVIWWIKRK
ncbi:hypothetical protein [Sphingobacterium sp.]|uniref:hypothetical protein n=1 Tax=Sphingobacterium sp. TaxID=341027 RepID=UPI0031CE31FC